jgi:hypothetical protein
VPRFFNPFVIGATAISGASLLMSGLHHLAPDVALFDSASGNALAVAALVILALIGVAWQVKNIATWIDMFPESATSR